SLSEEGHDVTLIEQKDSIADRAREKVDARVLVGSAFDPAILESSGVVGADMVIAVTNSDVINLSICSLASVYGAKRKIARVRDMALTEVVEKFGRAHFYVDEIINPDEFAAQTIIKVVEAPGSREVADFSEGRILLRSFDIPPNSPLVGVTLGTLGDLDLPWPFLVVAIHRGEDVVIPRGENAVESGDRIYVLLPKSSLAEFLTYIHPSVRLPRKVIVYGATGTGMSLARGLVPKVKEVVFLEENRARAEKAAGELNGIRVIHGMPSDADILRECGVEATDIYIAVSSNDHHNLISAVLAKQMGAKGTVIVAHQPEYASIAGGLGIDSFINPRLLATDQILRMIHGTRVCQLASLPECKSQVLEFVPAPGSAITKGPIRDVRFPKNAIVGAVNRGSEVILAKGNTQVQQGDSVVVFCKADALKKLEKLFTGKNPL
ncbi:MAG: Trk system potassium transporter TrkA, partial [Proteobacteria bacterium]|nr:Trk system potassium transporter TrkA [Pseudomonadota bacterium]